jgi:hypothetical protein
LFWSLVFANVVEYWELLFASIVIPEKSELDIYKTEPEIPVTDDPIKYWKNKEVKFPVLSRLARRYLCIPCCNAAVERVWSVANDIATKKRNRLSANTLGRHTFLKFNKHHW